VATEIFDSVLGDAPNQKDRRPGASVAAVDLTDFRVPDGEVTDAGIRANIRVALAYLDSWLGGVGAAAIDNLMEDAATAEIARSQLWLWRVRGLLPIERYAAIRDEELASLGGPRQGRLKDAWDLLDHLVLDDDFADFLTLRGYAVLE
jgi:malate synthase